MLLSGFDPGYISERYYARDPGEVGGNVGKFVDLFQLDIFFQPGIGGRVPGLDIDILEN